MAEQPDAAGLADAQSPGRGRARRATAKRVNYAKEQEFSDEDIFEDSGGEDNDPPETTSRRNVAAAKRKSTGRPRKKAAPATTAAVSMPSASSASQRAAEAAAVAAALDMEEEEESNYVRRPVYTEKGYDMSLPPIRDRFPFLPEYEEDGSPKIELIVGRRPIEEKNMDEEDDVMDKVKSDAESDDDNDDTPGRKTRRRASNSRGKKATSPEKKEASIAQGPVEYEYLVKYKGRSYLHLEWKTGADLESMNKSAKGIYRRYLKKVAAGTDEDLENPEFDPSYVVPEKILDEAEQEIYVELTDKELLKWEKQREKEIADDDDNDSNDEKVKAKRDHDKENAKADEKKELRPGESDEEKKGTWIHSKS